MVLDHFRGGGKMSGGGRGVRGRSWGAQRCPGYRWASAIDGIYMIKKVVARASGTDLASSLKQNKFWMRGCVSVSVSVSVSVCVACPGGPPTPPRGGTLGYFKPGKSRGDGKTRGRWVTPT